MRHSLLLLLVLLYGCGGPTVVIPDNNLDKNVKTTVDVDRRLLVPCDDLAVITQQQIKPEDLYDYRKQDLLVHKRCKENHSALVDLIKKAFNLK